MSKIKTEKKQHNYLTRSAYSYPCNSRRESTKGNPKDIPTYNKYGKRTGYKKDKNGNIVITKLDDNMLRQIAEIGDGIYRRASNSNVGLDEIYEEINKSDKSEIEAKVFSDYEDQFQWFLGAAIILLIIELLISSGKKDWESKFNFFEPKQ